MPKEFLMELLTFLIIIVLMGILAGIIFAFKYIRYKIQLTRAERNFKEKLAVFKEYLETRLIIITDRLGEGPIEDECITFEESRLNHQFALNSTLKLLKYF